MDVATLSRIQFALTVSFHFLFPPMTIGISVILVIVQSLRLWSGRPVYHDLARFWTKVFGLIFAIGVATGIPLQFQFGTNWAQFARFVGDIFGSPLAIEGIYAFFLESGFLALLLFGWNRIGPAMHWFSTLMVAVGAHFSAIWILVANSWMQTPAGYHLARRAPGGGAEVPLPADFVVRAEDLPEVRAVVHSFTEAILNPSTIDRLLHTLVACWMTGAFVVAAVSAWWLLRGRHTAAARTMLKISLAVAMSACVLQGYAADRTARGVSRNQPTKFASLEGWRESGPDAGLSLIGWVRWQRDGDGQIVGIEEHTLRVPGLLSILVSGSYLHPLEARATRVAGLDELPTDEFLRRRHPGLSDADLAKLRPSYWPNIPVVFQTYHLMVALGVALTGIALAACTLWALGVLWNSASRWARLVLWSIVLSPILAQIATQCGWLTAEFGRQPWIVYEVLLTREAASSSIRPGQVLSSIIMFTLVYAMLFVLFIAQLTRLIGKGPEMTPPAADGEAGAHVMSLKSERQTKP